MEAGDRRGQRRPGDSAGSEPRDEGHAGRSDGRLTVETEPAALQAAWMRDVAGGTCGLLAASPRQARPRVLRTATALRQEAASRATAVAGESALAPDTRVGAAGRTRGLWEQSRDSARCGPCLSGSSLAGTLMRPRRGVRDQSRFAAG